MFKTLIGATALALISASASLAASYKITVTNTMDSELLAPVLVTDAANDKYIFTGQYVTPQAEEQILTGDPAALAKRIGARAMAGHRANIAAGKDGPPGVLLAPGKSLVFIINTEAEALRLLAMVAPTQVPDNYVTAVIDLGMMGGGMMDDAMAADSMADDDMASDAMADDSIGGGMMMSGSIGEKVELARYDIGNDEGTRTITPVPGHFATVAVEKVN